MNLHNVIIAPMMTEKTETAKAENAARYTFKVQKEASKESIRQALYHIYKVNAIKINTARVPGKKKRFRAGLFKLPTWKKAIVTLQPGQKIEFSKG